MKTQEPEPQPAKKLPYTSPTLKRLGGVQELTLTAGTVMQTEPFSGITPKRAP